MLLLSSRCMFVHWSVSYVSVSLAVCLTMTIDLPETTETSSKSEREAHCNWIYLELAFILDFFLHKIKKKNHQKTPNNCLYTDGFNLMKL